jgi:hypothetical protein
MKMITMDSIRKYIETRLNCKFIGVHFIPVYSTTGCIILDIPASFLGISPSKNILGSTVSEFYHLSDIPENYVTGEFSFILNWLIDETDYIQQVEKIGLKGFSKMILVGRGNDIAVNGEFVQSIRFSVDPMKVLAEMIDGNKYYFLRINLENDRDPVYVFNEISVKKEDLE